MVAGRHRFYIFRGTPSPFDFKNFYTTFNDLIDEPDGIQILGRHNILVVDLKFNFIIGILNGIASPARLIAGTPVSGMIEIIQAQVTFP